MYHPAKINMLGKHFQSQSITHRDRHRHTDVCDRTHYALTKPYHLETGSDEAAAAAVDEVWVYM